MYVDQILDGRVLGIEFERTPKDGNQVVLSVKAKLSDPLNKIRNVTLLLRKESDAEGSSKKMTSASRLLKAREHSLVIDGEIATTDIKLKGKKQGLVSYAVQVKYQAQGSRKPVYSIPEIISVTFGESASEKPAGKKDAIARTGGPRRIVPENYGKPAAPLEAEVVTKLPGVISSMAVAGGGRYLVCKIADLEGLVVYDAFDAKIAKIIKLPSSNFIFAAGGKRAVVYLKDENALQTWDLTTFERIRSKMSPFPGTVTNLVMGHSRSDIFMARFAEGSEEMDPVGISFADTAQLALANSNGKDAELRGQTGNPHVNSVLCASGDLRYVTEWTGRGGLVLFAQVGDRYEARVQYESTGPLSVSENGSVYTANGKVFESSLNKVGEVANTALFPSLGGGLILSVGYDGRIKLCTGDGMSPICMWGAFPGKIDIFSKQSVFNRGSVTVSQRILLNPAYGRAILIPKGDNQVVLRPFDLKGVLAKANVDFLFVTSSPDLIVTPGKKWEYKVEAMSKAGDITYQLQMAPEGMEVSASGVITWTPQKKIDARGEKVILLLTDKSGVQTFHNFTLNSES